MSFKPTGLVTGVELVEMEEDEDFIMRPIRAGMCRYESAIDGTLNLGDFARMNDAMNVFEENERRIDEKQNKPDGR